MVLFSLILQHTPLEKLDKKHFAKGARRPEQNGVVSAAHQVDDSKEITLMEAKIEKLLEILSEVNLSTFFLLSLFQNNVLFACADNHADTRECCEETGSEI